MISEAIGHGLHGRTFVRIYRELINREALRYRSCMLGGQRSYSGRFGRIPLTYSGWGLWDLVGRRAAAIAVQFFVADLARRSTYHCLMGFGEEGDRPLAS